jgi:alpha-ketoglutaric semialdehyde dehydrogenase
MESSPVPITGQHFISGERSATGKEKFTTKNSITGEALSPDYSEATQQEIDACLVAAEAAYDALQLATTEQIAQLLEGIASGLEAAGDALLERAHAETALPLARLTGERGRTVNQSRMFAQLVREGSWVQARVDHANPEREPLPKPDVRTMLKAVGPVVVFGASNFPLAISVAGTDTISALAARCPVVVKAHPGHAGTCEMIADVIARALADADLPAGAFSMVQGAGIDVGQMLVKHPLTAVVAFTGSLDGGRSLMDTAARRENPIPVYAEMGSCNPVFILPGAAAQRAEQIAQGYVQSVTMGVGQFCTNPGIVLGQAGPDLEKFMAATATAAAAAPHAGMLHSGIHAAYESGVAKIANQEGVEQLAVSVGEGQLNQAACTIFAANVKQIDTQPELLDEVFGPTSLILRCETQEDMLAFARRLEGQLTATIHGTEQDLLDNAELVRLLERKVGRIVFNGFPTGIEVCAAMHHGGPYPATSHSGYTSIGHAAIYRFTKPVCYQNFPESALPAELQDANPQDISQLVDDQLST